MRRWLASAIGLLMIISGVTLILEGQALGDQTRAVGTWLGLLGVMLIAIISSLDLFKMGKDDS